MNDDFRVAVGFSRHPKIRKLWNRLRATGVLALIKVWEFTAQYFPKGILRELEAEDIELAVGWNPADGDLVATLVELQLLEERSEGWAVPNWEERNGYAFHAPERSERGRRAANIRWGNIDRAMGMQSACAPHAGRNAPSPIPVPEPSPSPGPPPSSRTPDPDAVDDDVEFVEQYLARALQRPVGQEDRHRISQLLRQGATAKQIVAGIILGSHRASVAGTQPRGLGYFLEPITEVRGAPDGYADHVIRGGLEV